MLASGKRSVALLLAAHGERGGERGGERHGERRRGAANEGVLRLAATLRDREIAQEVAVGFIKGAPSVGQSVRALLAGHIVVYPLFLSGGYFTRVRLPQLLKEALWRIPVELDRRVGNRACSDLPRPKSAVADLGILKWPFSGKPEIGWQNRLGAVAHADSSRERFCPPYRLTLPRLRGREGWGRSIEIASPLGLEPALAGLVVDKLVAAALACGMAPARAGVVLLAHGSRKDAASRIAAEQLAERVRRRRLFRAVRVALIEEAPSLREAACGMPGPIMVFGLFAGDGMHGAEDAPRLIGELGRADVLFAGTIAGLRGIANLIADAVARSFVCGQAPAAGYEKIFEPAHRTHVSYRDAAAALR